METFLKECIYLIHLVRCAIHDLQPRELPEGMSFELVYECGVYHHVANIAFYSVEKLNVKPDPELYHKWQDCRDMTIVRDINQSFAADEIRDSFQNAGIRWVEVQGTRIKPLYPSPEWRTMSDIDFIVDLDNLPQAAKILDRLGYRYWDVDHAAVHGHRPPNINVEIHSDYFEATSDYANVMRSPFASLDENGQCEQNVFYLYNILHIAKHYFRGGCGIRRVLDAYYLDKHYGCALDHNYIHNSLRLAGAEEFYTALVTLAREWFGADERDCSQCEMAGYILNSGLHGNRSNEIKNRLDQTFDNAASFAKLRFLMMRFLGGGGTLKRKYPVLERHKILYPFCWLHRGFCALKPKKIRRIRNEIRAVLNTEETED